MFYGFYEESHTSVVLFFNLKKNSMDFCLLPFPWTFCLFFCNNLHKNYPINKQNHHKYKKIMNLKNRSRSSITEFIQEAHVRHLQNKLEQDPFLNWNTGGKNWYMLSKWYRHHFISHIAMFSTFTYRYMPLKDLCLKLI